MRLAIRPLTPERWPDLEAIFQARGGSIARGCWCMYYRVSGKQEGPPAVRAARAGAGPRSARPRARASSRGRGRSSRSSCCPSSASPSWAESSIAPARRSRDGARAGKRAGPSRTARPGCCTVATCSAAIAPTPRAASCSRTSSPTRSRCPWPRRARGRTREMVGVPVLLADGLDAGHVTEAAAVVEPFRIDLCSSVRTENRLDSAQLAAFFAALR